MQQDEKQALVLFFKKPQFGIGKQRLAASIGKEKACEIAECLLSCAFEDMKAWQGTLVFAVASASDLEWLENSIITTFKTHTVKVISQPNGNMGERLNFIDRRLREEGLKYIYYIGSDAPVLTKDIYVEAKKSLRNHDSVLALSTDGGVTLMGSKCEWPNLKFLPWSTEILSAALTKQCEAVDLSVCHIDGRYDVDTINDLNRANYDLCNDNRVARKSLLEKIKVIQESSIQQKLKAG